MVQRFLFTFPFPLRERISETLREIPLLFLSSFRALALALHLSKIYSSRINWMIHIMHLLGVQYLNNTGIFIWRLTYDAEIVVNKCKLVETVDGFINATLHKTCCPVYSQMCMYSEH